MFRNCASLDFIKSQDMVILSFILIPLTRNNQKGKQCFDLITKLEVQVLNIITLINNAQSSRKSMRRFTIYSVALVSMHFCRQSGSALYLHCHLPTENWTSCMSDITFCFCVFWAFFSFLFMKGNVISLKSNCSLFGIILFSCQGQFSGLLGFFCTPSFTKLF